jgi:DNA-binding XRE family transcriptional regulator
MMDEGERLTLAQLLKLARVEAGMTQTEAAEAIGMHPNSWQNFEYGKGRPDLWLPQIEIALGLPSGWFMAHLDPVGSVVRVVEDVAYIRTKVDELETLMRRLL